MTAGQGKGGGRAGGRLVRRHTVWTRLTHWLWAVSLFFLMLSGLQVFNAHPVLHVGEESGFAYDNAVLAIGATGEGAAARGFIRILGAEFDTTGFLGVQQGTVQAIPAALTIPSYRSLAAGRVVHFFFAWLLLAVLALWLVAAAATGHLRDLVPTRADLRALPRDIADHARLRLRHGRGYGALQKLAYAGVLFVLLPLMILTGLTMSPWFNAWFPWTLDLFGGRQTARTLHFAVMLLLAGFFAVHMLMVLLAGPVNELRSILTGWYRIDPDQEGGAG
ncbi:MAG: cytochrome b/b6 domain-containing protein [Rhodobacteraceae bacterium]|nr:cytochrome b/b6 domain-containing protein [Paracoccaceae bacterium]